MRFLSLFLFFFGFFQLPAFAVVAPANAGWTQGISSTGQGIWFGPGNMTKSNASMGQAIWNTAAAGVEVTTTAALPFGGGTAAATAKASISPAAAAGAIGKFAAKVAYPVTVGFAVYDLAKELGFNFSSSSSGPPTVTKNDPTVCSVAPCYGYRIQLNDWDTGVLSSASAACSSASVLENAWWKIHVPSVNSTSFSSTETTCTLTGGTVGSFAISIGKTSVAPSTAVSLPSSLQELQDAIAAKSGWPTSSTLAQALKDALNDDSILYVPMVPIATTGPASILAPPVVTTTNDGTNTTVKTEQTKTDITYGTGSPSTGGAVVPKVTGSTTTTTTTNVTNNSTNVTTTTNSTVNNPAPDVKAEEVPSDTALPAAPKLYTPKYPTGLEGVWSTQKANLTASPLANLATHLMPTVAASGSCPTMMINLNLATWANFGTHDFAPPCYIWDIARAIILIGALLLARALVFGG